jgi:hypothetical protein
MRLKYAPEDVRMRVQNICELWINQNATENVIPSKESYYTWKLGPTFSITLYKSCVPVSLQKNLISSMKTKLLLLFRATIAIDLQNRSKCTG